MIASHFDDLLLTPAYCDDWKTGNAQTKKTGKLEPYPLKTPGRAGKLGC